MNRVIHELTAINWDDDVEWRKLAVDIIVSAESLAEKIADYMQSWEPSTRAAMMDASHETSSHYKWLLYRSSDPRFTVWLHDYKPASASGPGYAQVPHNHRYALCSILLSGGYESIWYDVGENLAEVRRQTLLEGDVLNMAHDDVHSLTTTR